MLPSLPTFPQQASWLNRAGRIDRSACLELKASDLWRTIPPPPAPDGWQKTSRKRKGKSYLLAQATITLGAYDLQDLHDSKPPQTLQGDHRTKKSNALKPHPQPSPRSPRSSNVGNLPGNELPGDSLPGGSLPGDELPGLSSGEGNPNKGPSRTKKLGLPTTWTQDLLIQRWRMHANLNQHFFACPRCQQRALKLFLPLCTEQELRDALTANLWLNQNQQRIARSPTLRPQASQLIARYAPLFEPRSLQCRKCLALRYGEVRT